MTFLAAIAAVALGQTQLDPNIVIWRTYKSGAFSRATTQTTQVINSLAEYQRYVDNYQPEGVGNGRDVDWGKEELAVVHAGTRNSGGYSVEVEKIAHVTPNEVRVSWAELTPIRGVEKSKSQTSPWTIVRVNRPGARLTFSGSQREGRLPGGIQILSFPGYDWGCTCCAACVRAHQNRLPWRAFAGGDDAPTLTGSTCVMSYPEDYAKYVQNYRMTGLTDSPRIDWTRDRLAAIHLGRKMMPGYQILIDHVEIVDQTRVDVSYFEIDPVAQSYVPNASTGPYAIVKIPRVGSIVTFTKKVFRANDTFRLDSCDCGCDGCRYCGRH